mgnify:FL=1
MPADQDVTAPEAANQGQGDGGPGPGNQGDVSPNDELEALRKENEGLRTGMLSEREKRQTRDIQLAEANGKLQGLSEAGQPRKTEDEPKITRAQLRVKVEANEMTEAEAEQIWEGQFERRLGQRIDTTVKTAMGEAQAVNTVSAQIDAYSEVMPEVMTEGSGERQRVQEEYNFLTSTGAPDGLPTQLQALRAAFGPINALKKIKGERPDTSHQDVGSGTGSGDEGGTGMRTDGTPKGLTARQRDYYTPRVGPGKYYPDWNAVVGELKFQDEGLTKRRAHLS